MYSIDVYAKSIIGMTRFIEVFDFFISPVVFDDCKEKEILLSQIKSQHGAMVKEVIDKIMCKYDLKNIYNKFGIHNKAIVEVLNNDMFASYIVNEYLNNDKIRELESMTLKDLKEKSEKNEIMDFNAFVFFVSSNYAFDIKTEKSLEKILKRYEEKK